MSNEHNKLSEQLWKTYLLRSAAGLLCFTAIFLYLNNIFTTSAVQYSDEASGITDFTFRDIVTSTQNTLDAIVAVIDEQVSQNYIQNSGIFCKSTLQLNQCSDFLDSSTQNQIVYDTLSTYLSFRCLSGTCSEVASLWDFFWIFKIRFQFIQYIFIQYQSNTTNSFVIPALENVILTEKLSTDQWLLSYDKGTLILSKYYTDLKITAYTKFDSDILLESYQIDLDSLNLLPLLTFQQALQQFDESSQLTMYSLGLIPFNVGLVIVLAIVVLFLVCNMQVLMIKWQQRNFKNIQALESLYRNQMHSIFTNKLPYNSTILCQSPLSVFFEDLSQIIDENYTSMSLHEAQVEKQEPFKFLPLLEKIKVKFQIEMKIRQQQRNNDISDLKYQIKTAVGDISDSMQKNFKEAFVRARELQLSSALFYNGYLSLLLSLERFEERLKLDSCVLPESIISLLRYMNFTINSEDLKFVFKFAFAFTKVIEDEIIMRLHFNLQQKYLSILRQHDFQNKFAIQLGLERELRYLQESIQNKRYIITTYLK